MNEDPTEKLIRELKEENEKLMEMLKKSQAGEAVKMSADDDDDEDDNQNEGMSEEGKNLFYLFGFILFWRTVGVVIIVIIMIVIVRDVF